MNAIPSLLTAQLDIWTTAETEKKSGRGRSNGNGTSVYGIKKLRELILELAVRGKLVPQDPNDEPAGELIKRIQAEKTRLIAEGKVKKDKPLPPISDEEKPFELPQGWKWVRIGSVGHDWGQKTPDSDFTYIEVSAIDSQRGIVSSPTLVKPENAPSRARKMVKEGTVIYSTIRPYLLNIAVIEKELFPEPIASTAFAIVHPFCSMPPRYFLCFFRSPVFIRYVESVQMGIAYPAINDGQFFSGLIPLPPFSEQHRIVAKVDELMALCDQLETQHSNAAEAHEKLVNLLLGTLTQSQSAKDFSTNWQRIAVHFDTLFTTETSIDVLKQTLLQLAVMGKLTSSTPKKPSVNLQDLFDLIDGDRGLNYPKSHDYMKKGFCLFLSTKNVRKNGFLFDETQFISQEKHETLRQGLMKRGDIVITTRGTLGNVAVYDDSVPYDCVRINSGMLILRPKCSDVIPRFVMVFVQSPIFDNELQAKRSGSAQPQIPAGILKSFNFPLFNIEEQHLIVAKVDELMILCDQLKSRITQASQLQQKLTDAVVEQAIAS